MNSISCIVVVGDGDRGVCMLLGAPMMQRISRLSLAWHWQGVCGHVHLSSHYGIVWSGALLLILLALVSVKKRMFLLA